MTSRPPTGRGRGSHGKEGGAGRGGITALLVLILLVAAGVTLARTEALNLPGFGPGPDCVVDTDAGEVELTQDQAQRATTTVALAASGQQPLSDGEVSDIDPAALLRLSDGPAGEPGPSLTCRTFEVGDLPQEELTATGLTPRAQRVREEMADVFGEQSLGGFEPGGVQRPEESTHNSGRAIDVFYRPISEQNRREGWLLAQWLVAHAPDLDIQYVIFDDQFWYSGPRGGRWQDYRAPAPANEILRHLDHVHVDVWRGD